MEQTTLFEYHRCRASEAKSVLSYKHNNERMRIQFLCTPSLLEQLMQQFEPETRKEHYDVFYDNHEMSLARDQKWLCLRDQQFFILLHEANSNNSTSNIQKFCEETDELQIKRLIADLVCTANDNIENKEIDDLSTIPFAFIPFIRYKFNSPKYGNIFVDEVQISKEDYYLLGTLHASTEEQRALALQFLQDYKINTGMVRSKVLEWLFVRNKPRYEHVLSSHAIGAFDSSESAHYTTPPIAQDDYWFENCVAILRDTSDPSNKLYI